MPIGKDIYNVFSKKMKDKQRRKGKPTPQPAINNFKVNKPMYANSLNQHPRLEEKKKVVSPNEGKPAVNASANVERLIHKPTQKKILDPGLAVIEPEDLKEKKKGRPRKTGGTSAKQRTSKTSTGGSKETNDTGRLPS